MERWICLFFIIIVNCETITKLENLRNRNNCGHRFPLGAGKYKMLGGRRLENNEYSWLATIKAYGMHHCSGVLISRKHVLTAAHCITGASSDIGGPPDRCKKKGRRDFEFLAPPEQFRVSVDSRCVHPQRCPTGWLKAKAVTVSKDYDGCTVKHDLAIIELEGAVSNAMSEPICMPTKGMRMPWKLKAAGSGAVGPSRDFVDNLYRNGRQVIDVYFIKNTKTEMVISAPPGVGICTGDEGGPLFSESPARINTLIGITAVGNTCQGNYEKKLSGAKNWTMCDFKKENIGNYVADVRGNLEWICEQSGVCPIAFEEGDELYEDVCNPPAPSTNHTMESMEFISSSPQLEKFLIPVGIALLILYFQ